MPLDICTNQYAFSYGNRGWHYWRSLVTEVRKWPEIPIEHTYCYRFVQQCRAHTYTELMAFHNQELVDRLTKLPFGSYPWGDLHGLTKIDPTRFLDKKDVRRTQNFMWFERGPSVDAVLRVCHCIGILWNMACLRRFDVFFSLASEFFRASVKESCFKFNVTPAGQNLPQSRLTGIHLTRGETTVK